MGELCQDTVFNAQWNAWGNLARGDGRGGVAVPPRPAQHDHGVAAARGHAARQHGRADERGGLHVALQRRQRRGDVPPPVPGRHDRRPHRRRHAVANNYNFPVPITARSADVQPAAALDGGVGPEFTYLTEYPKYSVGTVADFYGHTTGAKGSALVRLVEPGASPRASFIVVNGIDRTTGTGSAFISRYSLLTLVHSFFAAGVAGTGRIHQLPRLQITSPTIITEINQPASIAVTWKTEWKRWDALPYTTAYAAGFTEVESDLVYVPSTRRQRHDVEEHEDRPGRGPGRRPVDHGRRSGPTRTVTDAAVGNETFNWSTPTAKIPEGSYLVRNRRLPHRRGAALRAPPGEDLCQTADVTGTAGTSGAAHAAARAASRRSR